LFEQIAELIAVNQVYCRRTISRCFSLRVRREGPCGNEKTFTDIPRIPGWLRAIFRLGKARSNETRPPPTG
jgi:hypothetical protein